MKLRWKIGIGVSVLVALFMFASSFLFLEVMEYSAMDDSVMKPSAMDDSVMKPSAMDDSVMKRSAVDDSVMKPSAMDDLVMKPSVMKPSAMDDSVMKRSAVDDSVMKPSAMDDLVMKPSVMKPSVMKPSVMKPSVMKPSAMDDSVMKRSAVDDSVMKPSAMDDLVMKPSVMKPSAMDDSVMKRSAVDDSVMKPSAMDDLVMKPSGMSLLAGNVDKLAGNVDKLIDEMEFGKIAFNAPTNINIDDAPKIQLLLSLASTVEELKQSIAEEGEKIGEIIKVSDRMEARLSGYMFQITAITSEVQAVSETQQTEWKWEVHPKKEGKHELHLTLVAFLEIDGLSTPRTIRTFDKVIEVNITATQMIRLFFKNNWQWLWAAIILPVVGGLWKRRKNS